MNGPIQMERKDDAVVVHRTDSSHLLREEADRVREAIAAELAAIPTQTLVFELGAVRSNDYFTLALIEAAGRLCRRRRIRMDFLGASDELLEALAKLNIAPGCGGVCDKAKDVPESIFVTVANATLKLGGDILDLVGFIGTVTASIVSALRHPRKIQWRETLYYMDKTGADAVPIITVTCFLMGLILGYQGVIQMGRFGIDLFVADLVGLALVKELGPLMVAMICTGRAGSAFAAEIGTMKVNEELDAMETMGLDVPRFLVLPKMFALVCVLPLLTVIGDIVGILGGMLVGVLKSNVSLPEYYNRTITAIPISGVMEGMLKSVVFAVLIAGIGCLRGFEADSNAKGVGRATTSSVVSGIFLIVVADAIITTLCN